MAITYRGRVYVVDTEDELIALVIRLRRSRQLAAKAEKR